MSENVIVVAVFHTCEKHYVLSVFCRHWLISRNSQCLIRYILVLIYSYPLMFIRMQNSYPECPRSSSYCVFGD